MRGPLAVNSVGPGAVDGLTVDTEPIADLEQDLFAILGKGAIHLGANVEKHAAVLGNDVGEDADDVRGRLELFRSHIEPGADGGVVEPGVRSDDVFATTLEVEDARVLVNAAVLLSDRDGAVVLSCPVVGGREEALLVLGRDDGEEFEVEVNQIGLVAREDLINFGQPAVLEMLAGGSFGLCTSV